MLQWLGGRGEWCSVVVTNAFIYYMYYTTVHIVGPVPRGAGHSSPPDARRACYRRLSAEFAGKLTLGTQAFFCVVCYSLLYAAHSPGSRSGLRRA